MRLILLLVFFKVFNAVSQPYFNATLSVSPANPTTNDSIRVIVKLVAGSGFSKSSSTGVVDTINKTINIHSCFLIYATSVIDTKYDTFYVGKLPGGNYTVNYTATPMFDMTCGANTHTLYCQTSFSVAGTTSLAEKHIENDIRIYPNPSREFCTIESSLERLEFKLINSFGQPVKQGTVLRGNMQVGTAEIPPGFYILELISGGRKKITTLIKE